MLIANTRKQSKPCAIWRMLLLRFGHFCDRNFNDDFRVHRPSWDPEDTGPGNGAKWTTMPQYFKEHGFQVYGSGKL